MTRIEVFPEFVSGLPEMEIPFQGARGWLLQGTGQQVAFVEFSEDVDVPEHSHAEQWEFCLAGSAVLHREGGSEEFRAGDNFFVPAGQPHAALVHAGYKAMILFNAPDRYSPKK